MIRFRTKPSSEHKGASSCRGHRHSCWGGMTGSVQITFYGANAKRFGIFYNFPLLFLLPQIFFFVTKTNVTVFPIWLLNLKPLSLYGH